LRAEGVPRELRPRVGLGRAGAAGVGGGGGGGAVLLAPDLRRRRAAAGGAPARRGHHRGGHGAAAADFGVLLVARVPRRGRGGPPRVVCVEVPHVGRGGRGVLRAVGGDGC